MCMRALSFVARLGITIFALMVLPVKPIFYPVNIHKEHQPFGEVGEVSYSDGVFFPESIEDLIGAYEYTRQNNAVITVRGSGFSFGYQAIPPASRSQTHFILSTEKLNGIKHLSEFDTGKSIVLRVGAGVTWKAAISWVKRNLDMDVIPFDSPTASDITISGAFSAHTYSRNSDVESCYMPDYVNQATVVTPNGTFLCKYDSVFASPILEVTAFETRDYSSTLTIPDRVNACKLLPGSLGKIGVITDINIRFKKINDNNRYVQNEVIYESHDLYEFVKRYVELTKSNGSEKEYDHGVIGVLQWSTRETFRGFMLGAKSCDWMSDPFPSFLGFEGPNLFNQFGYMLAHAWTTSQFNEKGLRYYTSKGSFGVDSPFSWTYFQDNLVEAGKTLVNYPWISKNAP